MLRRNILALAMGLGLSACASAPQGETWTYDPGSSEALNIWKAAGFDGLADGSPSKANGNSLANEGYAISTAVTPAPGFSSGAGLAFGALSLLTVSGSAPPAWASRHYFAFRPVDMTGEQVAELLKAAIVEVAALGPDYSEREGKFAPYLAPATHFRGWVKEGCPTTQSGRTFFYDDACSGRVIVTAGKPAQPRPPMAAPTFVGSAGSAVPTTLFITTTGIFKQMLSERGFIEQLSGRLPRWIFIYLPPEKKHPPVIYRHGTALPFEKPAN